MSSNIRDRTITALVFVLAFPIVAAACNDQLLEKHLSSQIDFLNGKTASLYRDVEGLKFESLALETDDQSKFGACDTVLFGVLESSVALTYLEGWRSLSEASPIDRFVGLQTFLEIQANYTRLVDTSQEYAENSQTLKRQISIVIDAMADQTADLISRQPDRVISSLNDESRSSSEAYRIITARTPHLIVFEFAVVGGRVAASSYRIKHSSSPFVDSDVIEIPSRAYKRFEEWAKSKQVRRRQSDRWYFSTAGYGSELIWHNRNVKHEAQEDALDELLRLIRTFIKPIPYVEPEIDELPDEGLRACIQYRTPEDDDLWLYDKPSANSNRRKAAISTAYEPFIVTSESIEASEGEDELSEPHSGEQVISWVEVRTNRGSSYVVFKKYLSDGRGYTRFKGVKCSN